MSRTALISIAVICAAVFLSLGSGWEMSGESWGYWFYARVFEETGTFSIFDRSPLYVLYLELFRWLGYPSEVTVEYLVTTFAFCISVVWFLKPHIGWGWAAFAVILWLPFFQVMEPPTQKWAMTCSFWAVICRRSPQSRRDLSVSYALWLGAAILRKAYLAPLVIFGVWDGYNLVKSGGFHALVAALKPRFRVDWPILIPVALAIWFSTMQWPNPGNTAYTGITTKWFPIKDPKSLAATYFFQGFNWKYIQHQYGSFEGKDFYFTNQELFNGETEVIPAIRANPRFIVEQVGRNIVDGIGLLIANLTELPAHGFLISVVLAAGLLYGALRATGDNSVTLFVIAHLPIIAAVILVVPEIGRHYLPAMPVVILGAIWCGNSIRRLAEKWPLAELISRGGVALIGFAIIYMLSRVFFNPPGPKTFIIIPISCLVGGGMILLSKRMGTVLEKHFSWARSWLMQCSLPIALIVCSTGIAKWPVIVHGIVSDLEKGKWRPLENRDTSMKASYEELKPLIQGCKGIMSDNNTFIYAFMDIPLNVALDIWEIPPFGHLGDGSYDGLRPERVDCLILANYLASGVGFATNYQIRYQNYLKLYAEKLEEMGAETHKIGTFGRVVILRR